MDQEQQSVQPQAVTRAPSALGVPIAIVIASIVVAGSIIYTGKTKGNAVVTTDSKDQVAQVTPEIEIAPVTDADHIRGNPKAPIVIVEYSDFECPFCKHFHEETMNKIMAEYGPSGKVAWVFRQFPIKELHPNAPLIAEASECVASLGGDEAFWKFADLVFGERAQNAQTNMAALPDYAVKAGVSKEKYEACIKARTYSEKVSTAITDAQKAGANGTPYSIVLFGGQKGEINGAQPYETVKQMIGTLLKQVEGN